jgi:hypothetical protein
MPVWVRITYERASSADGSLKATTTSFGQYASAGFRAVSDGNSGTGITYSGSADSFHAIATGMYDSPVPRRSDA